MDKDTRMPRVLLYLRQSGFDRVDVDEFLSFWASLSPTEKDQLWLEARAAQED